MIRIKHYGVEFILKLYKHKIELWTVIWKMWISMEKYCMQNAEFMFMWYT